MSRNKIAVYEAQLESLWRAWDGYLERVPTERWSKRYGPDWTYADVPWHIAYFDRVMVADVIEKGRELPPEERFDMRTVRQLNAWNEAEFAKRPAGTTPEESIAEMRRQRERVRRLLAAFDDEDLARPAYNHFFGVGWSDVESALAGARLHTWSELFEFGLRLDGRPPRVEPVIVHAGLDAYLGMMPVFADPDEARRLQRFTVGVEITGDGGGEWTIQVADGIPSTRDGGASHPDVRLRMSADTYMRMFKKLTPPPLLMLTGRMRVKPLSKLGTFGKLFAEPAPDRVADPKLASVAMSAG
jgi:hypothetical protein